MCGLVAANRADDGDGRDCKRLLKICATLSVTPWSCRLPRMSGREREAEKLQAVKGMNDILPDTSGQWEWLEEKVRSVMARFAYRNIRTPIIVFASWGDNISPPQQALNWIEDVYGRTDSPGGDHDGKLFPVTAPSGAELLTLDGHTGAVPALTYLGDNRTLLSAGWMRCCSAPKIAFRMCAISTRKARASRGGWVETVIMRIAAVVLEAPEAEMEFERGIVRRRGTNRLGKRHMPHCGRRIVRATAGDDRHAPCRCLHAKFDNAVMLVEAERRALTGRAARNER